MYCSRTGIARSSDIWAWRGKAELCGTVPVEKYFGTVFSRGGGGESSHQRIPIDAPLFEVQASYMSKYLT